MRSSGNFRFRCWFLFGFLVGLGACTHAPSPVPREAVETEVARAEAAFGALRAKLMTRLTAAIAQSGPAGAIEVCGSEAQAMAMEIGRANSLEVGRTSFRLRNPANAPKGWAKQHVDAGENRGAMFDLGKTVGVLSPMPVGALCLTCHGPRDGLAPEVGAALAKRYPSDRAVDFSEGELRGYFWAEVPKM